MKKGNQWYTKHNTKIEQREHRTQESRKGK